ncbi:hypothetical protein [Saccharopolyspora elongata]|uniref:hypothetical protein n=1 Tax=Saccharopolyspora elongata TaxID=2530387 RepID=UPI002E25AA14
MEQLQTVLGFDCVATSCDYYLATAARAAGHLGLPGPKVRFQALSAGPCACTTCGGRCRGAGHRL